MQTAETVLSMLNQKSKHNAEYKFKRLYRNLFNEDFYIRAYQRIYHKEGNMTQGVDGKTIDGFGMKMVWELISELKGERYQPKPVRRTYIPKRNGKMRPLGIPTFKDKLLQEALREILEAIYEPIFLESSHGFRPNKSCHTALNQIQTNGVGTTWVVEGDITGFFDNINHDILLDLIAHKVDDGRIIELIRRFLKAGYLEFNEARNSLTGTPQGGIISPLLANIYLHEMDKYMETICKEFNKGKRRKPNPVYDRLRGDRFRANRNGKSEDAENVLRKMREIPSKDIMDADYVRVRYYRYADDFLVCVIGSKQVAQAIKEKVSTFLSEKLALTLNHEKSLITNLQDGRVRFLGYEIAKAQCNTKLTKASSGITRRSVNGKIQLFVPQSVIQEKIKPFMENGKPAAHRARVNMPVLDIISQYNAEIRGLYNYYKLAVDVSKKLGKFRYYHYYSLVKTIALKDGLSVKKAIKRYGVSVARKDGNGTRNIIGIPYQSGGKMKTLTYFNEGLKRNKIPNHQVDDKPIAPLSYGSQLIQRLNANRCELCGCSSGEFEVHHVRKLKDIKQKYSKRGSVIPTWVLQMCRMKRKTLVLCKDCHFKLHKGKI